MGAFPSLWGSRTITVLDCVFEVTGLLLQWYQCDHEEEFANSLHSTTLSIIHFLGILVIA